MLCSKMPGASVRWTVNGHRYGDRLRIVSSEYLRRQTGYAAWDLAARVAAHPSSADESIEKSENNRLKSELKLTGRLRIFQAAS